MKTFKIYSPAYSANGLNGMYYSIAICNDNGDFVKIIGDHSSDCTISDKFFYEEYKNVHEIVGLPYSDSDRFISVDEVTVDLDKLQEWELQYKLYRKNSLLFEEKRMKLMSGDIYAFLYDRKGNEKTENRKKYESFLSENPMPELIQWYGFLDCIKNED